MIPEKRTVLYAPSHAHPQVYKQTASNENVEHHLITDAHFKGPEHQLTEK